jgi:hypothetical protein
MTQEASSPVDQALDRLTPEAAREGPGAAGPSGSPHTASPSIEW